MTDVHDFVSQALQEGHDINDVVGFLSQSKVPEEQSWAKQYLQTAQAPAYQAGAGMPAEAPPSQTGLLNTIEQNPKTAAALAAATYGIIKAPGLYNAYQDRQIKKEELDIERQKAATYSQQVEKQGLTPEVASRQLTPEPGVSTAPLSPVEQIKIEREQIKLQREQAAAAHEAEVRKHQLIKLARDNELAALKQEQLAGKAKGTAGLKPEEITMLANSQKAKAEKAIDASLKASQPTAAVAPVVSPEINTSSAVKPPEVAVSIANEVKPLPDAVTPSPEGMRPTYAKSKKNPIGPGGYNWVYGQEGEAAPARWRELFGEKNVPYEQAMEKYRQYEFSGGEPGQMPKGNISGGTHPKPAHVPEYIKGNISPIMAANLAGNALGAAGLAKAYEHGKKTGDWSELGLGTIGQVLGNVAPRAAIPFALMSPSSVSSGTLDSPEAKELFARIRKSGAVPPPQR